jgi:hypothetical protein
VRKQKNMDNRQFGERLLEVTLLLIGLQILNLVIYAIAPTLELGDWILFFIKNSSWIGNILFGIIMYKLTKQDWQISISIGILSTLLPVFGGLFYLLTLTNNKDNQ